MKATRAEAQPAPAAAPGTGPAGRHRAASAALGVLVAGFALAIGQLLAAFVAVESSPIVAVGQATIDLAPPWLKDFAIRTFGSHDKQALIVGMLVVLTALAALAGVAAVRRPWVGIAALVALGTLGAVAALTRPDATVVWAIPSIGATFAGVWALSFLLGRFYGVAREARRPAPTREAPAPHGFDRRTFMRAAFAVGSTAVVVGVAGKAIANRRFAATASRAEVRIPPAKVRAKPFPARDQLDLPGLSPFYTPNDRFYRVDTAIFPPQVQAKDWSLRIHGMVDHDVTLDFARLLDRELIERDVTLCCVSNGVGGSYVGNARWTGALLAPLLEEAGVQRGADQIVSTSADGMTIGTPTAIVMDGRDAMLAVAMNGEPLPIPHGFPVRMIVPGLYGYVSATKWVVDLELTTFDAYDPYWIQRGWAEPGPIKTESRIDTPRAGASLPAGTIPVAGVAWAQHVGITRVEVQVDDAPWQDARLAPQDTIDTWRQWVWEWDAQPGHHFIRVRATDASGAVQPQQRVASFPSGATGWHTIDLDVV
ncbi:MAG: molybdopterin-dependent oxidoreductase [Planctomycetaceae bacterium]